MIEEEPLVGPERYDDLWRNLLEGPQLEQAREWLRLLRGQVVVDLGSGGYTSQFEKLLHSLGVLDYIPVEKDKGQDMLEVLQALKPAATYSVTMNGINQKLIPAESDYGKAVGEQINRLLHPLGLVFGVGDGGVLRSIAEDPKMDSLFIPIEGVLSDTQHGYYFSKKKRETGNT